MDNVLNTVKTKATTTKVLAILGIVLIILGLFCNVGTLKFKVHKKEAKSKIEEQMGDYKSLMGDDYVDKMLDELDKEAKKHEYSGTEMKTWGGPVILILGVAALAMVFIDFVKAKYQ